MSGSAIGLLRLLLAASLIVPALLFAVISWMNYRTVVHDANRELQRVSEVAREHVGKAFDDQGQVIERINDLVHGLDEAGITAAQERLHELAQAVDPLAPSVPRELQQHRGHGGDDEHRADPQADDVGRAPHAPHDPAPEEGARHAPAREEPHPPPSHDAVPHVCPDARALGDEPEREIAPHDRRGGDAEEEEERRHERAPPHAGEADEKADRETGGRDAELHDGAPRSIAWW